MAELRAFVGHSFTDDDQEIVSRFLKMFDQIKASQDFIWDHAEKAQALQLKDKVIELMEGKNIFIGICTRKELAIARNTINEKSRIPFSLISKSKMEWKTSDWVIQEIGYALGKGLTPILLMENGVRRPGGLQGDIEYIPFSRKNPDAAFGKILEMLASLQGKQATLPALPVTGKSLEQSETQSHLENWLRPQTSWTKRHYLFTYIAARDEDNTAAITEIDTAYRSSPFCSTDEDRQAWEAFGKYIGITVGEGGSLAALKGMAQAHSQNSDVLHYLASGLNWYKEYIEAAVTYEKAAATAKTDDQFIRNMRDAALAYNRGGQKEKAQEIIEQAKTRISNTELEASLLRTLGELASQDCDHMAIAALERTVAIDPSDVNTRFDLAFKYSNAGNNELALYHYLLIPAAQRNPIAWNNLGVAYTNLKIPSKGIAAYRKAEEGDEPLAMSNLAQRLLNVGFMPEAQELCRKAQKIDPLHTHVASSVSRIAEIPEEEDKKENTFIEAAKPISKFYAEAGASAALPVSNLELGKWIYPDCELDLKIENGNFLATGSFTREVSNGILGLMGMGAKEIRTVRVEYQGRIHGRCVEGQIKRLEDGKPSTLANALSDLGRNETKFLAALSEDARTLEVMEQDGYAKPKFYTISRR